MSKHFEYKTSGVCSTRIILDLEGITCGSKPTSCPDQIARALKACLAEAQ